ncbi:MAG: DsbA family protein, partial [Bacteroidetes bacterium]
RHFENEVDFEVVLGGLRPYNKETMADLKDFLTHHWQDVHKASGQEFNYDILDDQNITYDTEPPSRAVLAVRELKPELEFDFFKAIQKVFYFENKNMHLAESYHEVLKDMEIDLEAFDKLFASEDLKALVKMDFVRARQLGVSSFPTLLIQVGDSVNLVARGFSNKDEMIAEIDRILE